MINTGGGLGGQGAYSNVNAWLSSGNVNSASTGAILLTPGSTDQTSTSRSGPATIAFPWGPWAR